MLEPQTYTFKHPFLQRHIAYFYFLKTVDVGFESRYYAFPHTYTVLNIHRNATFIFDQQSTKVFGAGGLKPIALVQGIRDYPMLVNLSGAIDKVTILFKPLGLNAFTEDPDNGELGMPNQLFSTWDNDRRYKKFLLDFFGTEDCDERVNLLEKFLLSMYRPDQQSDLLSRAIELLTDFEGNLSIVEICSQLTIHVRTFNRLFKRHIGVSPVVYRKVARFRNSLAGNQQNRDLKKLAELAYKSNYYDQAYFTKIYRSLTGSNPQRFFSKIKTLADERLILEFLK